MSLRFPLPLLTAGLLAAGGCGEHEHVADVGEVEQGQTVCPAGAVTEGIDVSHWQGTIDWAQVKGAGKAFAFMKATEGTTYFDPNFTANWAGTAQNGVIHGAYHFFRAALDPTAQADWFIQNAGAPGSGSLPPLLDLEVTDGQSPAVLASRVLTWLQRVEQVTGRTPMVYTSASFFTNNLTGAQGIGRYPLFVANWGVACPNVPTTAWPTFTVWQYTDAGTVPGISGAVDLDRFNGSLQDLQAFVTVGSTNPDLGGGPDLAPVPDLAAPHDLAPAGPDLAGTLRPDLGAFPGDLFASDTPDLGVTSDGASADGSRRSGTTASGCSVGARRERGGAGLALVVFGLLAAVGYRSRRATRGQGPRTDNSSIRGPSVEKLRPGSGGSILDPWHTRA